MFSAYRMLPAVSAALALACSLPGVAGATPTWSDSMIQLHASGFAYLVDPATDTLTATLETCKGGTLGSITPDATKLYVSCTGEEQTEVVVLDLAGKQVAKRLVTGNRPKHGLVSPDGKLVGVDHWALSDGKLRLAFIDTATDEIVKELDIDVAGEPAGPTSMHNVWSPDAKQFFTMDRVDNRVVVVDTDDWSLRMLDAPSKPHYPVVSPDGNELWLVHEGSDSVLPGIVVFDLTQEGMPVVASIDMPLIGEEVVEAHHGNFTQDGTVFMALNRGPGSDSRGREVAFFDAKTKELLHRLTTASNGVGHTYNSPDGKYAVVTNYGNNVITVIDVAERKTIKDLVLGTGRMGHVAFTPDGAYGYVSNAGDGDLYKIDMNRLSLDKVIETGAGTSGGGQVQNVWTNVFEELPR